MERFKHKEVPTPLPSAEERLERLKQALLSYCHVEENMVDHPAWVPTATIKKIVNSL